MGYLIAASFIIYHFFVPWKIKKNVTLILLAIGIVLFFYGCYRGIFMQQRDVNGLLIDDKTSSKLIMYGIGLVVLHFITIMTSKGAWGDSRGIEGYNESKRLILGECPYCNKKISRTAKVCPHCTTQLF